MAPWLRLAALPASVLALIVATATTAAAQHNLDWQWPYNLPPDAKYYPEDDVVIKRDIAIQQKLQRSGATVTGVRKMSGDPGEKFYLDYWGFAPETEEGDEDINRANNATLASLDVAKRGFQCPSGTTACTSIDRPNSCCATDSTCQLVTDTGLGDVGCCAHGQVCAGSLSTCAGGYTSCPNNPGGGCCIPGYACYDVGCVQTSTATLVSTPTPTETPTSQSQTKTQPPSTTTVTSYTTITPSPSPTTASESSNSSSSRISTSTPTSTPTPTTTLTPEIITVTKTVTVTSSSTPPPNSLTCSTGYRSCPASLGGGCCPTDRDCGSANCPARTTATSSSATAAPPVRPTSLTTTETTTVPGGASSSSSSRSSVTGCPTGFYACSAYYQGGCCQVGRNCDKTSCPASGSTTLVDNSAGSLTIVAPTGSGITAVGSSLLTGACAKGWSTCAPGVGGGCCPSGYACEVSSCAVPASVTGGSDVGKMAPKNSAVGGRSQSVGLGFLLGWACACAWASGSFSWFAGRLYF